MKHLSPIKKKMNESIMEPLNHECGIAMIRLLKPLEYYEQKYGSWQYGFRALFLMMDKQRNRGQQGAGVAAVKLRATPGSDYMFRERALDSGAISEIFSTIEGRMAVIPKEKRENVNYAYHNIDFAADLYMGHLRYSPGGHNTIQEVHPFLRRNNWKAKNLALCGNFHLTNGRDVLNEVVSHGQHPRRMDDSYILLEQIGHRLDREVERVYGQCIEEGLQGTDVTYAIEDRLLISNVLKTSAPLWDGGYVVCGITGSGESFAVRDPWGVRTAFWYKNDEMVVLASERPAIQTALNLQVEDVHELNPGEALLVNKSGEMSLEQILPQIDYKPCSFERVYFSRGNDRDIYNERKTLGMELVEPILKAVDYDIAHTVISFIPNTSEVAFFGMAEGLNKYLNKEKIKRIEDLGHQPSHDELDVILSQRIRSEKVAIKDIKLRTFITEGESRNDLAAHVYDITYGSLVAGEDNLVVIDDSIVRGTTLKQSILGILDRLGPKKIVIVSSCPQVRYPDYYGIDMESMDQFVAFRAAVALIEERGMWNLMTDTYKLCRQQLIVEPEKMINGVKAIYKPFTPDEISNKCVELLTPVGLRAKVEFVYQTIEGLHVACPNHPGDWYFSGDYPTYGGTRLVNQAFINYYENIYTQR